MSDISELERRITSALDRIGIAAEALGVAGSQQLAEELSAEREANAQLEARVRAIKEKQETMVADLQDEVAALRDALTQTDADLQRLRSVNAELRDSNSALRKANSEGVADPDLVNTAMETEIEALRELNEANRAEIDRVLNELEPMLGEVANA